MKKPKQTSRTSLDYHDCIKYIENKYTIQTRDYAGKFNGSNSSESRFKKLCESEGFDFEKLWNKKPSDRTPDEKVLNKKFEEQPEPPYQDFWHWIIDKNDHITNGSYFTLSFDYLDSPPNEYCPEWVQEIIKLIKKEFGEGKEELEFYVDW